MRIAEMTWMQVEAYLQEDARCVIPLGSTEQHAYLSLSVDAILAERVAVEAAEPLGVPVFPAVPYGLTPYFMGFPGTVTLEPDTYERVLREIFRSVRRHGFVRVAVVNGHGGNAGVRASVEEWAVDQGGIELLWWDWWKGPKTMAAIRAIDPDASHASWMEGFPWTRVPGVDGPAGKKAPVDLADREGLSPEEFRVRIGDGSFGGYYRRPDGELMDVWRIAVEETRETLTEGW